MLNFLIFASQEYTSKFKVLEESINLYEPNSNIIKVDVPGKFNNEYIPNFSQMKFIKVLELLENGLDEVITIGADCVLYKSLDAIKNLSFDILVTSHIHNPVNNLGRYYSTGMVNSDFNVFRNTDNTKNILKWLIKQPMLDDKVNGIFYDQTYLTALPFIFNNILIFKDDSYNVAWWNLHERSPDNITVFHFSGFNGIVFTSKHSTDIITKEWKQLYEDYNNRINHFNCVSIDTEN